MEMVMVVPTCELRPYLGQQGLNRGLDDALLQLIENRHLFLPRADVEEDPSYRQLIPYVTLCRPGEVFVMQRLKRGMEKRLHGLLSLGAGGHIDLADENGGDVLLRGLRRELHEELRIERPGALTPVGIIHDNSNAVGRVHLGLFFTLSAEDAAVRETEKLEGSWVARSRLPALEDRMENWSRIVLPALLE